MLIFVLALKIIRVYRFVSFVISTKTETQLLSRTTYTAKKKKKRETDY